MKGRAHCTFRTAPGRAQRFENVTLTYIGNEQRAILSRDGSKDEPEDLLCLEAVQLDILSAETIDLEGFVCTDEETQSFHKCFVIFAPVLDEKEAA